MTDGGRGSRALGGSGLSHRLEACIPINNARQPPPAHVSRGPYTNNNLLGRSGKHLGYQGEEWIERSTDSESEKVWLGVGRAETQREGSAVSQ